MDNWLNIILQSATYFNNELVVNCYILSETDEIVTALKLRVSDELDHIAHDDIYFETSHDMLVENETIVAIRHNI